MRSMFRHLTIFLVLSLPVVTGAQTLAGATRANPEIVTSGSGVVKLKPDRATLTVAVVTRATSAAEAGRLNVSRIRPVIAALKRHPAVAAVLEAFPDAEVSPVARVARDRDEDSKTG